jgi:nucleotide-binding universal stress UspA family protein
VEARHSVAPDLAVGDELLNMASDLGSDLLVMGAYGRSRLREAVLGGATQHLLRHMTIPVLMSH